MRGTQFNISPNPGYGWTGGLKDCLVRILEERGYSVAEHRSGSLVINWTTNTTDVVAETIGRLHTIPDYCAQCGRSAQDHNGDEELAVSKKPFIIPEKS